MTYETIKNTLSMHDVAVRYGFEPDRAGMIVCPFHDDVNPSLQIYDEPGRGFHCFACGAGSSVIDFVMLLFNIEFKQAVLRISMDFGYDSIPADKQAAVRITERRKQNGIIKSLYCETMTLLSDHRLWCLRVIDDLRPTEPSDEFNDLFCEAIASLPHYEYLWEVLHDADQNAGRI